MSSTQQLRNVRLAYLKFFIKAFVYACTLEIWNICLYAEECYVLFATATLRYSRYTLFFIMYYPNTSGSLYGASTGQKGSKATSKNAN